MTTPGFDLDGVIRRIPDHPHPGILFYDLMPLFQSADGLASGVTRIADWARPRAPELVVGIEARGFVMGGAVAAALGVGFAAARKTGKLPHDTVRREYALEYGTDALEIHTDAVTAGQRVLLVDDVLATGGTAAAAVALFNASGAELVATAFLIELLALGGRSQLGDVPVHSILSFP